LQVYCILLAAHCHHIVFALLLSSNCHRLIAVLKLSPSSSMTSMLSVLAAASSPLPSPLLLPLPSPLPLPLPSPSPLLSDRHCPLTLYNCRHPIASLNCPHRHHSHCCRRWQQWHHCRHHHHRHCHCCLNHCCHCHHLWRTSLLSPCRGTIAIVQLPLSNCRP
jgi:hypothetical protein